MKWRAWLIVAFSAAALSLPLVARLRASSATRVTGAPGSSGASIRVGSVRELLWAVPFRVQEPFVHHWRKEQPRVSAGYLLVLAVDPEYVRPRETAEPVLYAGDQTIERVNHGFESGRVVAILPTECEGAGPTSLGLAETPFWFGAPELPERITAREIRVERERAEKTALRRFSAAEVSAALKRGGAPLSLSRREDLEAHAGRLVLENSPDEYDLADGLLAPTGK